MTTYLSSAMKLFAAGLVVCVWAVIFVIASIISWFDPEEP